MSLFVCPICGAALEREPGRYRCPAGHSYDVAREGYTHLLPANRKHSKMPGDDKGMAAARSAFLSKDYYAALRDALCRLALDYAPEHPAEPPPRPVCTRSPLCVGCPYPANGFFCWGKDGKCLRSEMRRLNAPDRQVAQEVKEE